MFFNDSFPIMPRKLDLRFAIRGKVLQWFTSYLADRKQCVRVGRYKNGLKVVNFVSEKVVSLGRLYCFNTAVHQ